MADLTSRVLGYIRKHALLRPGDRVGVAVSGGADSVALLRILLELRSELGAVLSVVHFNHKLRGADAKADEAFVRDLAARHGLEFHTGSGEARAFAESNKLSIETAARELRYDWFRSLIENREFENTLDKVATAHTLDDQAETVLMRILRGTGVKGLAGIAPRLPVHGEFAEGDIVRPLLDVRRGEVEDYLRRSGQSWREDATNCDTNFTRNRVRHVLLPLLEREFNASVRKRLSELAEIARAEDDYWESETAQAIPRTIWGNKLPIPPMTDSALRELVQTQRTAPAPKSPPSAAVENFEARKLNIVELNKLPLALKRRVIRAQASSLGCELDFYQVQEVLGLAPEEKATVGPVTLPGGWRVVRKTAWDTVGRRTGAYLQFERPEDAGHFDQDYSYTLTPPAEITVSQTGTIFRARLISLPDDAERVKQRETPGCHPEPRYNRSQLLNPLLLTSELLVRNWRPGDRFWPAHTGSPKKVKELLQQKHVTGPARAVWPVVLSGDEIIWMRGFPVPEKYRAPEGAETALLIEEETIQNG